MIHYYYKNAELLFIGINPHPGSFERGVPFSNNKMFWYLLSDAGLINETRNELRADSDLQRVYKNKFNRIYKLGLVNIINRPTKDITGLIKGEELFGRRKIQTIIKNNNPKVVCFVGKITYEKFIGNKNFSYGWQTDIGSTKIFVMHAPLRGEALVRIKELQMIKKYL